MKKILIIVLVLLLLGGGGFAAWWFYLRPDPNAPPPPAPPPELSQLTIPEKSNDALTISVIKNGKVTAHYFFRIVLIFDDATKREKVQRMMPELTNDIVIELHSLLARKLVEEAASDINQLTSLLQMQLQKVCDRRFGKGAVNQVSISNLERAQ